jgi:phosphonate transport system ATP-binding protein
MLEVKNLTKVYGDGTVALRNISFTVPDGEFLVVIGLSGAGKSTLLRCINRLVEPTEGEIFWNGVNITHIKGEELRKVRRSIGMIFQNFNLVKRSTVMKNVMSGRLGYNPTLNSIFGKFSPADNDKAKQVVARLGITDQVRKRAD